MSYENAVKSLESYFNTQWSSATPIVWQNTQYQPDDSVNVFVSFNISHGFSSRKSISSSTALVRKTGLIEINIYTRKGTGTRSSIQYADSILSILQIKDIDNVTCKDGYISSYHEDAEWLITQVVVPFFYDDLV